MYKRYLVFGSFLLLFTVFACQTVSPQTEAARTTTSHKVDQDRLRDLLKNLDQVIMSSTTDDLVRQTYMAVRKRMESGHLYFLVDKDSTSKDILQGVYYSPNAKGSSWIICTPYIIKLSQTRPELVLSLLINAMVFAESHAEKGESFILDYKNPLNAFLYSMDALYVQSLFIDQYLAKKASNLGAYERYLADGLGFDGLSSVAMYVVGVDQMIVYGVMELGKNLGDGSLEAKSYFDQLDTLFDTVIARMLEVVAVRNSVNQSPSLEDGENQKRSSYIAGVSALSVLHYGLAIIDGHLTAYPALRNKVWEPRRLAVNGRAQRIKDNLVYFSEKIASYRAEYLRSLGL